MKDNTKNLNKVIDRIDKIGLEGSFDQVIEEKQNLETQQFVILSLIVSSQISEILLKFNEPLTLVIKINDDFDEIFHYLKKEDSNKIIKNEKIENLVANFSEYEVGRFYKNPQWEQSGFQIKFNPNISIEEELKKKFLGEKLYNTYQMILLNKKLPEKSPAQSIKI